MTCDEYTEQVSEFFDGEIAVTRSTGLFDHLSKCANCRLFLDILMKTRKAAVSEEIPFPKELDERVLGRLNRARPDAIHRGAGRSWLAARRFSWSIGFAVAALLMAFLGGGILGSFLNLRGTQPVTPVVSTTYGEQGRQPAAVLIIYSLPEVQSTGFVPLKYHRERPDTGF